MADATSGSGSTAFRARALSASYGTGLLGKRREVLRGLDLELARGGRLGLIGPNGSGKSTLLRILAGIEPKTGGELEVLGDALLAPGTRQRIGYVPEDSPFPRELRAEAALVLLATLRRLDSHEAHARAGDWLRRVGLGDERRTPLSRFSRGMLRRFALAQAFVHEPDILLLDEPTAGLDARGFDVLNEILDEACRRGATLVICSHMPGDLRRYCEQLWVLVDGRVVARGAPAEVLGSAGGDGRGRDDFESLVQIYRDASEPRT